MCDEQAKQTPSERRFETDAEPAGAALLNDLLPIVEQQLKATARWLRLPIQDQEDFYGWAYVKLLERDGARLRAHQPSEDSQAYLGVVIRNLGRDYRNKIWGKWRASAAARREGPVAVKLEQLRSRDGLSTEEAIGVLSCGSSAVARAELDKLVDRLPQRTGRLHTSVDPELLVDGSSSPLADAQHRAARTRVQARKVEGVVRRALQQLREDERELLVGRFCRGSTVAAIARERGCRQSPLYSRIHRILGRMRGQLLAEGITSSDIAALVGAPEVQLASLLAEAA